MSLGLTRAELEEKARKEFPNAHIEVEDAEIVIRTNYFLTGPWDAKDKEDMSQDELDKLNSRRKR